MKEFYLESFDKKRLFVREFNDTKKPKAAVLIVHGMSEHSGRYIDFAEFLNSKDIIVYVYDLRAHGKTDEKNIGIVKRKVNYFSDCVLDINFMAMFIKEKYRSLSLTVLGHSFGSYLVQGYIQKFNNYDKIILSGSSYMKTFLNKIGLFIADTGAAFKGKKAPAKLIFKMSFASYKKKFENRCWISSDPNVTKLYNEDNFCNKKFSYGFYQSFLRNSLRLYKKTNAQKIDKQKQVYIFSGKLDPVGNFGKSVLKLYKFYKKNNIKTNIKLYENGRHEMLNEINKKEVYNDFLKAIIE